MLFYSLDLLNASFQKQLPLLEHGGTQASIRLIRKVDFVLLLLAA